MLQLARSLSKNGTKSPFWREKVPVGLNYKTKSSLVFEDHFIDCVRKIRPFQSSAVLCSVLDDRNKKNVVAVISLTEWLVKGRRHFGFRWPGASSRFFLTTSRWFSRRG